MGKVVKTTDKVIGGFDKVFIEDPRRAIVIGAFIVLTIVLIVVFWGKIKALFSSITNKVADSQDLNQHMSETGETTTLSSAKYNQLAAIIYQACDRWGTDEDAIYNAFNQLNNTADYLKLNSVFGLQDGHNLDWWIRSELSNRERRKLNEILANKGIDHTF
jgi:hypothetical protein